MTVPTPSPEVLWHWLPLGYALTVSLELPVLLVGLAPSVRAWWTGSATHHDGAAPDLERYTLRQRLAAALWLTAVTYPIVVVALPLLLWPRAPYVVYLIAAEAVAMTAECLLFRLVWQGTRGDLMVVAVANAFSATAGLWLTAR